MTPLSGNCFVNTILCLYIWFTNSNTKTTFWSLDYIVKYCLWTKKRVNLVFFLYLNFREHIKILIDLLFRENYTNKFQLVLPLFFSISVFFFGNFNRNNILYATKNYKLCILFFECIYSEENSVTIIDKKINK